MLAGVVGDEETGCGPQFLGRIGDVAQFKMGDFAGEREIADAIEQRAIVAVAAPRQEQSRNFDDLLAFGSAGVQGHQFLQHPVRWIFVWFEVGEGDVANLLAGCRVFQKSEHFGFGNCCSKAARFILLRSQPIAEVRERFQHRCPWRHLLAAEMVQRVGTAGDFEHPMVVLAGPILEYVFVKQIDVFGDLRLPEHLLVFALAEANHAGHECGGGAQVVRRERKSLRVEVVDGDVAVRLNDDGFGVGFNRLGVNAVGQPLLNDDGVGEVAFGLRKQVADGDGFSGPAHAQQNGVLRETVPDRAGEGFDSNQILVRAFVDGLGGSRGGR